MLKQHKNIQASPEKYGFLKWTERSDNGKKCSATEGKTGQI